MLDHLTDVIIVESESFYMGPISAMLILGENGAHKVWSSLDVIHLTAHLNNLQNFPMTPFIHFFITISIARAYRLL